MPFKKEKSRKTNTTGRPDKNPEDTLSGQSGGAKEILSTCNEKESWKE